ncbi:CdaR family transcriptional regulator [Streptomyces sp. WMMB 322]|uniref:PucR family transcriptional regulator n=1 Tax=Streptomyces sp. WMMB 322 TaxID=1286821 RepID=UPI0006E17356|nr:helix-turn-helix domain-containing protein [Streptomyces sp. WMMB 322]SCK06470.1 PucR C-terminal helix-turn-helix domain-containing protein [Streptomyces sp. WMMB 322]
MGVNPTEQRQSLPAPATWGTEGPDGLRDLVLLSIAMFDGCDEEGVLHLAMAAVSSLTSCTAEAGYLRRDGGDPGDGGGGSGGSGHVDGGGDGSAAGNRDVDGGGGARGRGHVDGDGHEGAGNSGGVWIRAPDARDGAPGTDLDDQVAALRGEDGIVRVPGRNWCEAVALRSAGATVGYLVVSAATRMSEEEQFLIGALAQQTSAALSNAAGRRAEREHAAALRRAHRDRGRAIARLRESVAELEFQKSVHEGLSQASAESEDGIADMVRAFTGLPVAVEDPFGNLRVWSGPGRPEPYPARGLVRREQEVHGGMRRAGPVRAGNRLTCIAQHRGKVFGTISLIDPGRTAGPHEEFVLDHACVALALELSHQRRLAETELRLRRELVEDLITGTDDAGACGRSEAVGHDLHGTHRLVVVRWRDRSAAAVAEAVGRSAANLGLRFLLGRRPGATVLAVRGTAAPHALHEAVAEELGSADGSVGIGGRADSPAGFPRSYEEAVRASEFRRHSGSPAGATAYDELGFCRILASGQDQGKAEEFVREWLGPLQDYDAGHHTDLVRTLALYFDCGGNYDTAASELTIHRSTLRYRLGRIREVSGHDLSQPDTRLNLHVATRIWQVVHASA